MDESTNKTIKDNTKIFFILSLIMNTIDKILTYIGLQREGIVEANFFSRMLIHNHGLIIGIILSLIISTLMLITMYRYDKTKIMLKIMSIGYLIVIINNLYVIFFIR